MRRTTIALAFLVIASGCTTTSAETVNGYSAHSVRLGGDRAGAVCAGYYGQESGNLTGPNVNRDRIGRRACFDTRAQCRAWFRAAQTFYPDVTRRFPCGTVG